MSGEAAARLLRERAESYGRDARALADEGNDRFPVIYRAIADELRRVAFALEVDGGFVWSTCEVCGVPVFRHYEWSHQGGTPPTDHFANPVEEEPDQRHDWESWAAW